MSVPDTHPKAWGGHKSPASTFQETTTYYHDGLITGRDVRQFGADTDGFFRDGSKNPVRRLDNSGTPWRNPGYYRRDAFRTVPGSYSITKSPINYWEDPWSGHVHQFWDTIEKPLINIFGSHPWFLGHTSPASMDQNTYNRLATEVMVKLGDQKSQVGANLAEALKTYDGIKSIAVPLFRTALDIKRGNWRAIPGHLGITPKSFRDPAKDASSLYLMYQFGVKPLAQDLYGLHELLQEQLQPALLLHARRTLRDHYRGEVIADYGSGELYRCRHDYRRTDAMHITARVSDAYARDLSRAGLINPFQIAWEVVPYSFLVDWVMPVGNVISAMDAKHGLTFVGGWFHTRINGATTSELSSWGRRTVVSGGTGKFEKFAFHRGTLGDFPLPAPYFKSPFSDSHQLTAMALLTQLIRSR